LPIYVNLPDSSAEETMQLLKQKIIEIRGNERPQQNRTFRCKWCPYSKFSFKDAPKEIRKGQLTQPGSLMPMCSQIDYMADYQNIGQLTRLYKYTKIENDQNKQGEK
jgi:hypothetical protein